jgi:hypothetical protein
MTLVEQSQATLRMRERRERNDSKMLQSSELAKNVNSSERGRKSNDILFSCENPPSAGLGLRLEDRLRKSTEPLENSRGSRRLEESLLCLA